MRSSVKSNVLKSAATMIAAMCDWHPEALATGVFFVLKGGLFLLKATGVWDLGTAPVWPLVLIGLGVEAARCAAASDAGGGPRRARPLRLPAVTSLA